MAVRVDDPHLRQFALSLEKAIALCGTTDDETFLERQKRQVDTLVALEREFRKVLVTHKHGPGVYRKFISYICDDRRNILDARPYFRERQSTFTRHISGALRRRDEKRLFRFNFNWRFVDFTLKARRWGSGSMLVKLAARIQAVRDELITMNMPLAISRARIFYGRTPRAHLSLMDLIQISCEGLMSGIDKFVPPFSKTFRSVAIGRMVGNLIDQYSETLIHFFPVDKRKIYRANKLMGRNVGVVDFDVVAEHVNQGVEPAHKTTASEICDLMAASSTVSSDASTVEGDDEPVRVADRFAAPESVQPDVICERQDAMRALAGAIKFLTPFERKLLVLKGVHL